MNEEILLVKRPGLLTTIQDLGRYGFQQYGIIPAGAMDRFSMQLANIIVGNERTNPVLEVTVIGPSLEVMKKTVIAITGADLTPKVNGEEIELWRPFLVEAGDLITFGKRKYGARCYIAIAGGIHIPLILNSTSTYLRGNVGGYKGRQLQQDDIILQAKGSKTFKIGLDYSLAYRIRPIFSRNPKVRVIVGPDNSAFTKLGLETFWRSVYKVTQQADRMGYRLEGPRIEHVKSADIISDSVVFGTIQVPASGQPIIMLADRQTTGGYTRIATVISVDLNKIVQLLPGDTLSFCRVSVEEAQYVYVNEQRLLRQLELTIKDRMQRELI